MPFVWIYGKCKRSEDNNHPYPNNPRIDEENTSISDAALRRGLQLSRDQYESEVTFQSEFDEAIRASIAQQNIDSNKRLTHIPTITSATTAKIVSPTPAPTESRPTPTEPTSLTGQTNGSTNRSLPDEGTEESFIFEKVFNK